MTDPKNLLVCQKLALEALSLCAAPCTIDQLVEIADPGGNMPLDWMDLRDALDLLAHLGFVTYFHQTGMPETWQISDSGRQLWGLSIAGQNATEYRAPAVIEERDPEIATVCIDEEELDDWWKTLDCDQKADAFTQFSLRMYSAASRIYIEPAGTSIPVNGTIEDELRKVHAEAK